MSQRWLVAMLSALALLAAGCPEQEPEEEPQPDVEAEEGEDDPFAQLQDAVDATLEEGTTHFESTVAEDPLSAEPDEGLPEEDAAGEGDEAEQPIEEEEGPAGQEDGAEEPADEDDPAGGTEQGQQLDGEADFEEALRQVNLTGGQEITDGQDVSVILDDDDLYVDAVDAGIDAGAPGEEGDAEEDDAEEDDAEEDDAEEDDEAADEDPQWVRVDVQDLVETHPQSVAALLSEPLPMLETLADHAVEVREGAEQPEGEGTDDPLDDGATQDPPDFIATVDASSADHPQVEALANVAGQDAVDVEVWLDADGTFVERMAYDVEVADEEPADDDGLLDEDGDEAEEDGDAVTDDPAERVVALIDVEMSDFGENVDVEVPDDDQVEDVDAEELGGALAQFRVGDDAAGVEPNTEDPGDAVDGDDV